MSRLASIPVRVPPPCDTVREWGNALPILHEVRHGLRRLGDRGERSLIDLTAMPFGPGDEKRLLGLLGRGEVEAVVDALGPTRIRETGIPGVWLVDHRNAHDERIALHIEIAAIPDILCTQPRDLQEALAALDARLAATSDATDPSPDN